MQMGKQEPNPASVKPSEHSDRAENDPESKRARIAAKARNEPKAQFNCLMHHLTYDLVGSHLEKIPTRSAPGGDGMTVKSARENLGWLLPPLLEAIHQCRYEAPPVRRVFIPKATGGQRPIGVPEVIDRSVQAAMATILGAIYEQDFLNCSFGFRPKIGCHHALATIHELLSRHGMNYALEVDIRDFFGSLNHDWLRRFLQLRIGDKRVLQLIDAWLKAGVLEDGQWRAAEMGTPQGGSISPLLSNIYLHYVLDLWFERKIRRKLRRKARLVRYADDFVILFQNAEDMDEVKTLLTARLAQFGLQVAEEKTHKTDLSPRANRGRDRRRMNFLGFAIFRARTKSGTSWRATFQTEGKRFTRARAAMKDKLFRMMHWDVELQARRINQILAGHFNYYGIAGNTRRIKAFWHLTVLYWKKCLSRRGQRGATNWADVNQLMTKYKLRHPQLRISYREMSSYVRL
jgi:RNA-directed DNA polymerase